MIFYSVELYTSKHCNFWSSVDRCGIHFSNFLFIASKLILFIASKRLITVIRDSAFTLFFNLFLF